MKTRHGFTLVELLVVVAIITVLGAILLPSLMSAMDSARTMQCLNNLRQINLANNEYVRDNNGWTYISDNYGHYGYGSWNTGRRGWISRLVELGYIPGGNPNALSLTRNPGLYCSVAKWSYSVRGNNYTYYYLDGPKVMARYPIGSVFPKPLGKPTPEALPHSRFVLFGEACYSASDRMFNWGYFVPGTGAGGFNFHLRHNQTGPAAFADGHGAVIVPDRIFQSTVWYAPWMYGSSTLVGMPYMCVTTEEFKY